MRLIKPGAWALAGMSAILQIVIFPLAGPAPVFLTWLAWIALVPLLVALLLKDKNARTPKLVATAVLGYFCGVLWYAGNCFWIYQTMYLYGGLPKPVAVFILILFALYLGLYHAFFALLFAWIRRSRAGSAGALLLAPILWVAVELARARITGFPWDLLGNTQVSNLLITRMAPWTGVMGISFLVVVVNACMASAWILQGRKRWLVPVSGCLAAAILVSLGSMPALQHADRAQELNHVILVQENLAVGAIGHAVIPLTQTQEYEQFSAASLRPMSGSSAKADLVVWPEAPSHFQSNDPVFRDRIGALARTLDAPMIVGSLGVDFSPIPARGYYLYGSASLFQANGSYAGRYDKIHRVPWGEYVPYKEVFSFADKLTQGAGNNDAGHERTIFHAGGHRYGVFICYESIFGDEVRQFVQNGAEALVNISDDGWYGDTGAPWQHLNMARMRAIENHRYILRSTNTGITTVIDPRGRIALEAPRHLRAGFEFPFAFENDETFYTRYGDWFAYGCAGLTLLALAFFRKPRVN